MPQSSRYGRHDGLPDTLRRSCQVAQAAFTVAYERAVRRYGETDQAYQFAFTMLKQKFEKCGDHWIVKCNLTS